ncbi:D-2-hydroxyacid dehydrogenase [Dasania sp. GY-MA-18]|uniref:D-2-hydroxyacid dehydrogenase n=1 Tax=Dasania phycosphaerae TaxID=2950436 RepID=A0A9J6RIP9_9GAMM|nr:MULTISPECIES: D-2-hydroxyacid dehydrogenase [Dasania]MCR8921805.1 D-2-hydroxyacid dehydrogenase [Dasania sp. GY-MA-18]MCZ0864233.1 D-2-hydroxyacid dehydrogenase [Dasania phycosphaerae]MCZ0867961.1 D-2-hydroxyacid dehydrogenase [Dasania phycosphaerae]
MKGVILDFDTLAAEDLQLSELMAQLDDWSIYPSTSPEQVQERIAAAEVVLSNKVRLDAETIKQNPQLKLIAAMATGTDHIAVAQAKAQGIVVCNARAYSTASVAQHTITLMLALSTRLLDYHQAVQQGAWSKNHFFCLLDYPIQELAGKTLGLIGYGNLAKKVAAIAQAFDMEIIIAESLTGDKSQPGRLPLNTVLAQADIISLHCPLSEHTRNLITDQQLALMKSTALLINTARGGIVDESALAQALKSGVIAGAAMDVLATEPPAEDSVLLQKDIPNLIITPHSAWASRGSRQRLVDQLAAIVSAYKAGDPIQQV